MGVALRPRPAAGACHLHGWIAVCGHRLSAVHLHDAVVADRTRHLFDPQAHLGGPAAVISRTTSRAGERRMKGEMRILGAAHGLLSGLVLAAPRAEPELRPWGARKIAV